MLKSGYLNKETGENIIKKQWTGSVYFNTEFDNKTLTHIIMETLEFIITSWLSRLLMKDGDQSLMIQNSSSGVSTIERHQSVVNKNTTEQLLSSWFEMIFYHLNKHFQKLEGIQSTDNNEDERQIFQDEEEDKFNIQVNVSSEDEYEDDEFWSRDTFKISGKKKIKSSKENEEFKKDDQDKTKYDHKVMVKLLRLIEMFTSVAIRNDGIRDFVIRVAQSEQVLTLARLLVSCKSRHGLIILKIFENLINIRFDKNTLDKSFDKYEKSKIGKAVFDIDTKTKFNDCPFLQFLYNLWFDIRSRQWKNSKKGKTGF